MLAALHERNIAVASVTLHVGAGTFQPVRSETSPSTACTANGSRCPRDHAGHRTPGRSARGRPARGGGGHHHAARAESAALGGELVAGARDDTDIFITPGFRFRVVDRLVTNFHLPKSTLMMLVSAFAGHARVMALYRHAIAQRYRFFSYGDAMLLER